ncbi:498_t:CDS:1, partial [Gigaspora rosea]
MCAFWFENKFPTRFLKPGKTSFSLEQFVKSCGHYDQMLFVGPQTSFNTVLQHPFDFSL